MIPARETKSRWIVSLFDDALEGIKSSDIKDYADTRDISILDIDTKTGLVKSTGKMATLFLVEPLKHKFSQLSDKENRNVFTNRAVFSAHVSDSRNAAEDLVRRGDRLADEALDTVPIDVIEEISTVIIELSTGAGRGATIPFSLPVGYWEARFDMGRMIAKAAEKIANRSESGTGRATDGPEASE